MSRAPDSPQEAAAMNDYGTRIWSAFQDMYEDRWNQGTKPFSSSTCMRLTRFISYSKMGGGRRSVPPCTSFGLRSRKPLHSGLQCSPRRRRNRRASRQKIATRLGSPGGATQKRPAAVSAAWVDKPAVRQESRSGMDR